MDHETQVQAMQANKEIEQLLKEHPEFVQEARRIIATWNSGEHFLTAAIALGLIQAYKNGEAGRPPFAPAPAPRVGRSRPAPGVRVTRTRR